MTKRVIVIGGEVTAADGDRHRVGARRVAELYGLRPAECWLSRSEDDARRKVQGIGRVDRHDLVVLRPDPTGLYRLPLGHGLRRLSGQGCTFDALYSAALAQPYQDTTWLVLADWCDDHNREETAGRIREWVKDRHRLGVWSGQYRWSIGDTGRGLILHREWHVEAERWRDAWVVMLAVTVCDPSALLHSTEPLIAPMSCRSLTARPEADRHWVVTAEYR